MQALYTLLYGISLSAKLLLHDYYKSTTTANSSDCATKLGGAVQALH
jgi:hypothetical protein